MSDHQLRRHKSILKILFPFYPIKIFAHIKPMVFLAVMIALRIIAQYLSIPIPGFVLSFSFAYLPVMMIGWFYGPLFGFVCGAICDTICFFIYPSGLWFWMYAIQEPIVGLMAGLIAAWCNYRKGKAKINIYLDVIIQLILCGIFAITSYIVLGVWIGNDNIYNNEIDQTYKWTSLLLISAFFILIVGFSLYMIFKNKSSINNKLTVTYSLTLVMITTIVFSFILGPISTVEYLTYVNGEPPANWVKYGAIFYLIPRIVVQSLKTPLEAILLSTLIVVLSPIFKEQICNIKNQWE